jgi:hypothetical protein
MKKIITLSLTIAFLAACSSSKNSQTANASAGTTVPNGQTTALIKKFKPIIQGYWIRKDYIQTIIQTKSPLAAERLTEAAEVEINTDEIKSDSIVCSTGDNHDGSYATLKFIRGKKPSTITFNGQDLSYSTKNGDTTLNLGFYDNAQKGFTFYTYVRAFKQPAHDFADNLEEYLDNILVTGDYSLLDSTRSTQKVHFDKNGGITGFLDLDKYFINYDLNSDVNDNLDGIYFKGPNKEQMNFTFKISADTLKFYDTRENADSTKLLIRGLKYQFVRQKKNI